MSDASHADAKARKILTVSIVVSLVLGALLGYFQYGSLLDVRSWNYIGLVIICVIGSVAGILAIAAAIRARTSSSD